MDNEREAAASFLEEIKALLDAKQELKRATNAAIDSQDKMKKPNDRVAKGVDKEEDQPRSGSQAGKGGGRGRGNRATKHKPVVPRVQFGGSGHLISKEIQDAGIDLNSSITSSSGSSAQTVVFNSKARTPKRY